MKRCKIILIISIITLFLSLSAISAVDLNNNHSYLNYDDSNIILNENYMNSETVSSGQNPDENTNKQHLCRYK